jgi:hypothetical protein
MTKKKHPLLHQPAPDSVRDTNEDCPRYVALVADCFVEADYDLETLIALVKQDGLGAGEDCACWDNWQTLAAVIRSDGSVQRFKPLPQNGKARRILARREREQ